MATFRKIAICALCAFCALALSVPSFAAQIPVDYYAQTLIVWNEWSVEQNQTTTGSNTPVINWADASGTDTLVTVGVNFPMLPLLPYQLNFTITTDNDTKYDWFTLGNSIGSYVSTSAILDYESLPAEKQFVNLSQAMFGSNHPLSVKCSLDGSALQSVYYFTATMMTDQTISEDYWKCITLRPKATSWNNYDKSFRLTLKNVTLYYDSEVSQNLTLGQVQDNAKQLEQLGLQVSIVNDRLDNLSTQVTTEINGVRDQLTSSTNALSNQLDELHKQNEQAAQQAHEDAQNAPQHEYEYIDGKDKELDNDVDDLELKVDLTAGYGTLKDSLSNFWKFLSSTDTQSSFYIKPFSVTLPSIGTLTFWEGGNVDFSQWLYNDYWMYRLIWLSKVLSGLFLLSWAFHFIFEVSDYLMGNSKKSFAQIMFGFNPFDFGG